jgi:hypothetical protein
MLYDSRTHRSGPPGASLAHIAGGAPTARSSSGERVESTVTDPPLSGPGEDAVAVLDYEAEGVAAGRPSRNYG